MIVKGVLKMDKVAVNKARALYYNMFANFFVIPSDLVKYTEFVGIIELLKQNPIDNTSGKALEDICSKLDKSSNVALMQEYDDIFNSPITKNIRTTASFYDEGYESGKKRAGMIDFVAKTKIRRNEKKFCEYEDSVGFIFSFLSELCDLLVNGHAEYEDTIHCVFKEILNDFIDEFASDLYSHESAVIYRDLMMVLHSFVEFERLYLGVSKPHKKEKADKKEKIEDISEEEKARRARNKELKKRGPKKEVQEEGACSLDVHFDVETDIDV